MNFSIKANRIVCTQLGCIRSLAALSTLALATSCGESPFQKYQNLRGLRVLAIKASTPEVSESSLPTVVQLTPVISDFGSTGETIAITGSVCPDPGVSFGAEPTCANSPLKTDLTIPSVTPAAVAFNSGLFGLPNLTGRIADIAVTLPSGLTTGRSTADRFNGIPILITLTFTAGNRTEQAYKRLLISNKSTVNANPTLTQTNANGTALTTSFTALEQQLGFIGTGEGNYDFMRVDGTIETRTENLRATFFITDGSLKRARVAATETVEWTPPSSAPSGRPISLVTVVYDDRGGVDFSVREIQ